MLSEQEFETFFLKNGNKKIERVEGPSDKYWRIKKRQKSDSEPSSTSRLISPSEEHSVNRSLTSGILNIPIKNWLADLQKLDISYLMQ